MIAEAWAAAPAAIVSAFLVFCRIGACLTILPGFGSTRVPAQIRLFIALGVTLAVQPALGPLPAFTSAGDSIHELIRLIAAELAKGAVIGLMGRAYMAALEFLAEVSANAIGLASPMSLSDDAGMMSGLASVVTLTAGVLLFATEQHWEIMRALVQSYKVLPAGEAFDTARQLPGLLIVLMNASLLAAQVCGPFVVYAIVVNFLFGIVNKVAPQIPATFVSAPFVIAGGLWLSYLVLAEGLQIFISGYASWLTAG